MKVGVVKGHTHDIPGDGTKAGKTSNNDGHSHSYNPRFAYTGPGGEDQHKHPIPGRLRQLARQRKKL